MFLAYLPLSLLLLVAVRTVIVQQHPGFISIFGSYFRSLKTDKRREYAYWLLAFGRRIAIVLLIVNQTEASEKQIWAAIGISHVWVAYVAYAEPLRRKSANRREIMNEGLATSVLFAQTILADPRCTTYEQHTAA